jgi:hypothetical protein
LKSVNNTSSVATITGFTAGNNIVNGAGGGANNKYDLDIQFQTNNSRGGAGRLRDNEIANIFLYGLNGLTAASFDSVSSTAGYISQAHIQGITEGDASSWVVQGKTPVPEPGTMMLLGIGMFGLAVYGKRRLNKEA